MADAASVGAEIRAARRRRGLSAAELGQRLGVSRSRIRDVESGRYNLGLASTLRIAEALEVDPHSIDERLASVPPGPGVNEMLTPGAAP